MLHLAVVLLMTKVAALSPDGKCRVLALRGGGKHGSFEFGVLKAFVQELSPLELHYDYLTGNSIGAINAAIFGFHDYGDEVAAI